jgi:hypothetical protein
MILSPKRKELTMKTQTITVRARKGSITVQSPYDDLTACEKLLDLAEAGEFSRSKFGTSLAQQVAAGRSISAKQMNWIHVLVVQRESKRPGSQLPLSAAN